jgi:hypothetical protein
LTNKIHETSLLNIMSFLLKINESNKKIFIQQQNYVDVDSDIIKIRNAFSENGTYEFYYTGNIVEFTIPTSGKYKIEAWGAMGGGGHTPVGPKGAYSKSFVLLNKDERIKILVGEKGYPGYNSGYDHIYCGGGGGGTFIAKDRTPLCVAGGGGSLSYSAYSTIQSHACGQATQLSVNIGYGQATLRMGGVAGYYSGGGGFDGNGSDGSSNNGKGGISFINGGARQTSNTYGTNIAYGGFGGGASNHGYCGYAVGGGGYTGGSGTNSDSIQGGGGGSYFEGFYNNEVSEAISGCNVSLLTNPGTNGNGFAKLTLLTGRPTATVIKYVTCTRNSIPIFWTLYAILVS